MGIVDAVVESLAKRDRAVVLGGLAVLLVLSWTYTVVMAFGMVPTETHGVSRIGTSHHWTGLEAIFMFLMWVVMMVAMMTPAAAPMLFAFVRLGRMRNPEKSSVFATLAFLLGYLALWTVFSLVATTAQWGLHSAALLSQRMDSANAVLSGTLLLAAGIYQFTPLKHACLAKCRAPMGFLLTEWRDGIRGTFVMGARHGAYCIGCCWLLMALLFVGGVMSLLWITGLAVAVLAEKVLLGGRVLGAVLGVIAIGWGTWLLTNA